MIACQHRPMRLFPRFPLISLVLLLPPVLAGCGESGQQQGSAPPPPTVTVANPVQRAIVDQDEYVGRFVPVNMVEVRARVSGYLEQVHFEDGQLVKQGTTARRRSVPMFPGLCHDCLPTPPDAHIPAIFAR